jgi:eukaryotic-like serine/threonine-protein kinase
MQVVRAASGSSQNTPNPMGFRLPPGLIEKSASRLCWISILCAVMTVVLLGMESMLQPEFNKAFQLASIRLTILGIVFLSIGFIVIQRAGWLSKERLLDVGIVFQVAISFAISMFETTFEWNGNIPVLGHSGVAVWLALCGLLLPNAPLKSAIAATLSALSWPVAYYLNLNLHGFAPLPWNRLIIWIGPLLLVAIWMYVLNLRMNIMQYKQMKAEELGSYRLDYLIGKGGMGEVWRAKHNMLARDAAVKLIRGDVLAGASARQESMIRQRFEREARATASLRSPNTVALYDFGRTNDNTFYYVMELLNGIDLQTLVERFGPLHPGRVANIILGVASSLNEAHAAGMVHRDIKPRNIFLAKQGLQYDFVKVLDFGLVKSKLFEEESLLTMDGTATGTPAYLAPEIAMGEKHVDGRADLYSLGCVAYFLLTGRMVFEEPTPTAMALAHVQKQPIPLSQLEVKVPAGLEQIVMRLLEKDPAKRIQSADELHRMVRSLPDLPKFCEDAARNWWQLNLPETAHATPGEHSDDLATSDNIVVGSPAGVSAR